MKITPLTTQHTPGPWQHYLGNCRWCVETVSSPARLVAVTYAGLDSGADPSLTGQQAANARLIAAAPELLDALTACAAIIQEKFGETVTREGLALRCARAAIAKAIGNDE